MDAPNVLTSLGLHGWGIGREGVLVAAIAANIPIMLIGKHGTSKTTAGKALAVALLGPDVRFAAYPCPEIGRSTLQGRTDLAKLREGEEAFIKGDYTVWDKQVVLLDEPNRAPTYIQNMLMEFVRTRKLAGQPTEARLVMSAMNPPEADATTSYLSPAMASRYVYVKAPDTTALMGEVQKDSATGQMMAANANVSSHGLHSDFYKALFSDISNEARTTQVYENILRDALKVTEKAIHRLYDRTWLQRQNMSMALWTVAAEAQGKFGFEVPSMRQLQHIRSMVEALAALYAANPRLNYILHEEVLGEVALSAMPEAFGAIPLGFRSTAGINTAGTSIQASAASSFAHALLPVVKVLTRYHASVREMLNQAAKMSADPAFDQTGWAATVMDFIRSAPKKRLTRQDAETLSSMINQPKTHGVSVVGLRMVRNRFNLRKLALNAPDRNAKMRYFRGVIDKGRTPRLRDARKGSQRPRVYLGRADGPLVNGTPESHPAIVRFNTALRSNPYKSNTRILRMAPELEDSEYADLLNRDKDSTVIITEQRSSLSSGLDPEAPDDSYLIQYEQIGGKHMERHYVFIDPSDKVEGNRVMRITFEKTPGSPRASVPHVDYVKWSDYTEGGLANVLPRTSDVHILEVYVNPSIRDFEESGLHEVLCHGISTSNP